MCLMWMGTQKEGKVRLNTMVKAILELEMPQSCRECPLKEVEEGGE